MQVLADQVVNRWRCFSGVANDLRHGNLVGAEAERPRDVVARLHLALAEVDRAAVQPTGRPGFEARQLKTSSGEAAAHVLGGGVAGAPADGLRLPRMHDRLEEGASCQDDGAGEVARVTASDHALDCEAASGLALQQQPFHQFLPQRQVLLLLDPALHGELVELLVRLGPRRMHGRPLGRVEHAELDAAGVRAFAHKPAEGVDLANDLPFATPPMAGLQLTAPRRRRSSTADRFSSRGRAAAIAASSLRAPPRRPPHRIGTPAPLTVPSTACPVFPLHNSSD